MIQREREREREREKFARSLKQSFVITGLGKKKNQVITGPTETLTFIQKCKKKNKCSEG